MKINFTKNVKHTHRFSDKLKNKTIINGPYIVVSIRY